MVGISGIIGDSAHGLDPIRDEVARSSREVRQDHRDDGIELSISSHHDAERPITAADGTEIWLWGEVYDYRRGGRYVPCGRGSGESRAGVIRRLYDEEGISFVSRLNGEFFGVAVSPGDEYVRFFTDRLARRPVYFTLIDGGLLFSSQLGSIVTHPETNPTVDFEYLCEFLAFQRTFGVKAPLEGVEMFYPGAVTSYDPRQGEFDRRSYWRPRYSPRDESLSHFVEAATVAFEDIFDSRIDDRKNYGVLVSGGSDSRLVLSALSNRPTGYHLNDWVNTEAEIAAAATDASGGEFEFLRRDHDYFSRLLSEYPTTGNFVSFFHEAHFLGFDDRLSTAVDELITGVYGDIMLAGYHYPTRYATLPLDKRVDVPVGRRISGVSEYVASLADRSFVETESGLPNYLADSPDLRAILESNIHRTDAGEIDHHGVTYPSLVEVAMSFYPITNDFARDYMTLLQIAPRWSPFLDDRIVDLALEMPLEYHLRGDVVNKCISRLDPELARIPHSETGVGLDRPFPLHYVGHYVHELGRQLLKDPPEATMKHGSWPDHENLIRRRDFVADCLARRAGLVESIDAIDEAAAVRCLREHLAGEDNTYSLYGLVSLLESPLWAERTDAREIRTPDTGRD